MKLARQKTVYDYSVSGLINMGLIYSKKRPSPIFRKIADVISSHYSNVDSFLKATAQDFQTRCLNSPSFGKKLNKKQLESVIGFQKSGLISSKRSLRDNFTFILTDSWLEKQHEHILDITLKSLNINPLLASALNLNTKEDLIDFYATQAASRSVVTSFGFLVQDLLFYSAPNIRQGALYDSGVSNKWDLVKEGLNGALTYFEIKSGPNDIDKTQLKSYMKEISTVEDNGDSAYIGITYGKKSANTATFSLFKSYFPDWEVKTLVGSELWDLISGDNNYHEEILKTLSSVPDSVITTRTFSKSLNVLKDKLICEIAAYPDLHTFLSSLW